MYQYIVIFLYISIIVVSACGQQNKSKVENWENGLLTDSFLVVEHLKAITKTEGYRNYRNIKLLDKTADYIFNVFKQYADTVYFQPYTVNGNIYKNVVCRFGKQNKPVVIVGAHYDVCGEQEGADDNASGVVGLLELARLLKGKILQYPVEIVAYSLEEPPFFRTEYMGSHIHAKSLKDLNIPVYGMVVLEMIGYFNDREKSQFYPVKALKVAYGTEGDYILLAKRSGYGKFVKTFSKRFNEVQLVETRNIKAPSKMQGMDFSDHLNYWKYDYDALMITNTAFYRNHNYHQKTDTMESLDISRMAKVIDSVYGALINL